MSAVTHAPHVDAATKSGSKKKKKNKKKPNGQNNVAHGAAGSNGLKNDQAAADDDDEDEDEQIDQANSEPQQSEPTTTSDDKATARSNGAPAVADRSDDDDDDDGGDEEVVPSTSHNPAPSSDPTARLDAMQQERDSLRAEVTQLRKSLESLQEKHGEEISGVKEELEQSRQGKEHAETQYRNLLTKVNTIRSQLGERLKADAAELEQARERIEELESSDRVVKEDNERLQQQVSELNANLEAHAAELETLRSRTTLSTSNWARERDDLLSQQAYLKEEYEVAKQAMQDWEILATDEKSRREALEDRMQGLEEQLHAQRDAYERIQSESELQNNTVDGLQRALRDLQEERKRELREMVEQSQAQLESLRTQTQKAEETAAELKSQLESTQKELERTAPFEKEVKEKNLLIGKLRHEAVILNDHLTKALRFLKRGKPEDNVDRQLVTNHFLHFLELDRSDPKKFQILGLIAALLGWDDQQKEQAGLVRQGTSASGTGLRVPMSPFRRTPSTPQLGEFVPESPGGASRETLAELWSDFLEREAEQGSGKGHSRRTSVTSNKSNSFRSPSMGALMSPVSERGGGPPLRSPGLQRQDSSDTTTTTATK